MLQRRIWCVAPSFSDDFYRGDAHIHVHRSMYSATIAPSDLTTGAYGISIEAEAPRIRKYDHAHITTSYSIVSRRRCEEMAWGINELWMPRLKFGETGRINECNFN